MKVNGFTVIELVVTISVLSVMACIAIPGYSRWLPGHKLKSASLQLLSNMQLAKMTAIRLNREAAVVFDQNNNRYQVVDGGPDGDFAAAADNITIKTINLTDFGSGVAFGIGSAPNGAGGGNNNPITFNPARVVFNGRGMAPGADGFAHLDNQNHTRSYAIGALATGAIRFRTWNGTNWE